MSRDVPSRTMPQPCSVPTMVRGAGPGCAQPLAQPEMCTIQSVAGKMARELGGNRSRRNQSGGAGRRARAGDDAPARIARIDDEAKLGSAAFRVAMAFASVSGPSKSARSGAGRTQSAPIRLGDAHQLDQRIGLDVPEGETKAERARAILQTMQRDRLGAWPRRQMAWRPQGEYLASHEYRQAPRHAAGLPRAHQVQAPRSLRVNR